MLDPAGVRVGNGVKLPPQVDGLPRVPDGASHAADDEHEDASEDHTVHHRGHATLANDQCPMTTSQ
jgi:hypothetical protein